MKKISLFVLVALAFALLANFTVAQASASPDPGVERVGFVVAYMPNEGITIVGRDGSQTTFTLAPDLKIVPKHRANLLNVGSFVTIISPANVNSFASENRIATGIVIHPQAPNGFPIPTFTSTPLPSATATETETPTAVVTETPTFTATVTVTETETPTETATPTSTGTVTTTTSTQVNTPSAVTSFVEWVASLFRQILTSNG